MYLFGEGVKKGVRKAVEQFQKAKLGEVPGDMWRLGLLYEEGKGVPEDKEEAISFIRFAARRGYSRAQLKLGDL